ncbi:MAG: ThiF family adenylyltransferase [Spirochaetes bacterium]|nr:ThiF family adenylyltransferase [Spirochaetota bacterium]
MSVFNESANIFIAGSLGSAASNCIAAAGIGTIRIIDCDKVKSGNLNRQFLYNTEDIGKRKPMLHQGD